MEKNYILVSSLLKNLSNPIRLKILCLLLEQEYSVNELVEKVNISQTSLSQHLAKLREAELVGYVRSHNVLRYHILDPKLKAIIETLHDNYCDS